MVDFTLHVVFVIFHFLFSVSMLGMQIPCFTSVLFKNFKDNMYFCCYLLNRQKICGNLTKNSDTSSLGGERTSEG